MAIAVQRRMARGRSLRKWKSGVTDFMWESKTSWATPGRFWEVKGWTLRDVEVDDILKKVLVVGGECVGDEGERKEREKERDEKR